MRMSNLLTTTLRDDPTGVEAESHRLLLRAGFVRGLAAGVFHVLPLGRRVMTKIEAIMRDEIEAIGGQEVSMPVVHPADLWKASGRWATMGAELGRFTDRVGREMVLAMTHEEAVTDIVSAYIESYKQLPKLVYHIQTKWRDDPRPRAGLIRAREFSMLDSYSLDANEIGLDKQYRAHYDAYFRIFERCGIESIAVESDVGMMGGTEAHEFIFLHPIGEDTIIRCAACGYTANRQIARFKKPEVGSEEPLPVEKVATPGANTIEELAAVLNVSRSRTAKAVFRTADMLDGESRLVFAVIRGDLEVNETKLANAVGARALRPSTDEEIREVGAEPGYASPVALDEDILTVVDDSIITSPNLVAGANEPGFHLLNVNAGRDFRPHIVADISTAQEGDACSRCGQTLDAVRGVEVGNIFKLGTYYSDPMDATFIDESGKPRSVVMGSYGIGLGRLMACIAESHHDKMGLAWPARVAPYRVHLVGLKGAEEKAADLYDQLWASGIDTLYDDRDERPGVKFKDADLIGCPLRVTVSERSIQSGGMEVKVRTESESTIVTPDELSGWLHERLV